MEEFKLETEGVALDEVAISSYELKRLYRLLYEYEQLILKYEVMLISENQRQNEESNLI